MSEDYEYYNLESEIASLRAELDKAQRERDEALRGRSLLREQLDLAKQASASDNKHICALEQQLTLAREELAAERKVMDELVAAAKYVVECSGDTDAHRLPECLERLEQALANTATKEAK